MFEISGVSAGYGANAPVLRDVNIMVPEASVVALLGANGAGKTTTLRVASGLLPPRRGKVVLDGVNLTGMATEARSQRGICHIPEGRGIYPTLSVRENLLLHASRGREKEATERAVQAFPALSPKLDQTAGTLSGGQQQMVALARAFVQARRVLLLDEVSMGLAPNIIDAIFGSLHVLKAQGCTLLLVEQYVGRALEIADYVYILNRGSVSFAGEPSELEDQEIFDTYLGNREAVGARADR